MSAERHTAAAGPAASRSDQLTELREQLARLQASTDGEPPAVAVPESEDARKAREILLRKLAVAPRSRAHLAGVLQRKEIPDDVAALVLDRYEQLGLVDDQAFAQGFVSAQHRDRSLGRRALRQELRRQGIVGGEAEAALEQVDPQAEQERAGELVGKRVRSALAAGPEAARRRLLGLLARRGYDADLSIRIVDAAIAEHRADTA